MERKIHTYGSYFDEFYVQQDQKIRDKIDYVLDLIRWEWQVPIRFLKYLEDTEGLYEVRIKTTFREIRIFFFFDDGWFIYPRRIGLSTISLKKLHNSALQILAIAKAMTVFCALICTIFPK